MRKLLERVMPQAFVQGERFAVIEIFRDHIQVIDVRVDDETKEVNVTGVERTRVKTLPDVKTILSKLPGLKKKTIILALGPHVATTLYTSVSMVRENRDVTITEAELENLVSQAMWKFFDRHREAVAKKLGVEDFDVIVSDARIMGIRLDGHKVVNPVGFDARSVNIEFSQTFLSREFSDNIREVLPMENVVFIGEAGTLLANTISQGAPDSDFMVAHVAHDHTDLFRVRGRERIFLKSINWGIDHIVKHLEKEFGVESAIAKALIERHQEKAMSHNARRRFELAMHDELSRAVDKFSPLIRRMKERVLLVHADHASSRLFFSLNPEKKFSYNIRVVPATLDLIPDMYGYDILGEDETVHNTFPVLSYLLEWRHLPLHTKLEQLAKRRVRWLSPLQMRQEVHD